MARDNLCSRTTNRDVSKAACVRSRWRKSCNQRLMEALLIVTALVWFVAGVDVLRVLKREPAVRELH